jgi:hypothetical protein
MTFEGDGLRVIAPLDPDEGPRYIEPIREEDRAYELENIYKLTARQQDYINPTTDGNLSWRSESTCSSDSEEALENWQNKMYEVSTRRCARLTREVPWIDTTVSNLPTFDGLNHLEAFLLNFEEIVPTQQRLLAMDEALKETPTRWWGTHKNNITDWVQCRTLMTARFSEKIEGCEVRYTGQSCLKDHVHSCEEAWRNIPQDKWMHKFINTLDTTPINWYLQAELRLITADWEGMTQNFVTTFLFESQYPSVDQALQIVRKKVFEEASSLPLEQEEDEWTVPLQKLQGCYNINVDEDDDPRKVNIIETEGQRDIEGPGFDLPFIGHIRLRSRNSILEQRKHRILPMLETIGMLPLLTKSQSYCMNIRTCFQPSSLI